MLRKRNGRFRLLPVILVVSLLTVSCAAEKRPKGQPKQTPRSTGQPKQTESTGKPEKQAEKPELPEAIRTGEGGKEGGEPSLNVYIVQENRVQSMPFEEYVAGVTAGEVENNWPEESIKAQAIIARTFVLQFIEEKGHSKYENAHVSTDVEEAQAWNEKEVNDRIRKAVKDTRGQVIVYDGEFARTWFHSNAGGKTATPKEGLDYQDEDPPYIRVVDSPDMNEAAEADAKNWSAKFTKDQVIAAMNDAGKPIKDFSDISIGKKGPSGRALTIKLDDEEVSAAELRLALGSTDMRSTLLDKIALEGGNVVMSGRGYGHGVGMSQWGARTMAEEGKSAEDIINHYFKDVELVKMWN